MSDIQNKWDDNTNTHTQWETKKQNKTVTKMWKLWGQTKSRANLWTALYGMEEKEEEKKGEYIGSTLAFSAAHHTAGMHIIEDKERCEHVW